MPARLRGNARWLTKAKKRGMRIKIELPKIVPYRHVIKEVRLTCLPVYPSKNRWTRLPWRAQYGMRLQYIRKVRETLVLTRQIGIFPCRVRVTPFLYLPGRRRRDINNYAPMWLLDALIGYIIEDDDQAHIEEGLPVIVALPTGSEPYLEVLITPIGLFGPLPAEGGSS